jgi:UDP-2-acetamido-3-amino-2,3-dideoxy-glucuronate N-acetyltransferase
MSNTRIHPTAEIEDGVEIGDGTAVWAHVHARGPSRVGRDCIVGEKTYIGSGVTIGNLCKLNAMVYVPLGVTLEDGVMIGAGTIFTNDRYPRGTDTAVTELADSGPGEHIFATLVELGASVGAGCTIGSNLTIGRFALVGMGAVVTHDVKPFHLVVGNPARSISIVCRCGTPVWRFPHGEPPVSDEAACSHCGLRYKVHDGDVEELDPPTAGTRA